MISASRLKVSGFGFETSSEEKKGERAGTDGEQRRKGTYALKFNLKIQEAVPTDSAVIGGDDGRQKNTTLRRGTCQREQDLGAQ